jgi:hypothetical protein
VVLVGELCVGDRALVLGTNDASSSSAGSLGTAGLVTTRQDGRVVYYELATNFPESLLELSPRRLVQLSRVVHSVDEDEA